MACENDGAPIPEYSVNPGDIMIKFSAAKSMQQKVGEKVGVEVDDKELTVLNHLCDDPGSSYVQIAKKQD